MKTTTKRWLITILGLLLVVGLLGGIKAGQIFTMVKAGASFAPPPESVATAQVKQERWQGSRSAIGSLVAVRAVTLGAELTGKVQQILFESGTSVRKGDVLVRLDISAEEAQLAAARADAALARATLERAKSLRAGEANSVADLDAAQARAQQTEAVVANLQATMAKKTIRAPFDGRIAIRPGREVGRRDHHHQPRGGGGHPQRPRPGDLPEPGRPAATGHVREGGHRVLGPAPGAGDPGHRRALRALRGLGLRGGGEARRGGAPPGHRGPAEVRAARGAAG
jgi:biotin carboxyl carrier protein